MNTNVLKEYTASIFRVKNIRHCAVPLKTATRVLTAVKPQVLEKQRR
jgi:hypothetical protein